MSLVKGLLARRRLLDRRQPDSGDLAAASGC